MNAIFLGTFLCVVGAATFNWTLATIFRRIQELRRIGNGLGFGLGCLVVVSGGLFVLGAASVLRGFLSFVR